MTLTATLAGVWHRLLEETPPLARGGKQDRSTVVLWTQSKSGYYVDLRLPLLHPGRSDNVFVPVSKAARTSQQGKRITDSSLITPRPSALAANGYSPQAKQILLSKTDSMDVVDVLLATQSFAGMLTVEPGDTTPQKLAQLHDPILEQLSTQSTRSCTHQSSLPPPLFTCHWQRHVDYQPPAKRQDIGVCSPQLPPAADGSFLLRETGDDASYAEDWLRLASASASSKPTMMAAVLQSENGLEEGARQGYWIWTDNRFAYAIGYPKSAQHARQVGIPVAACEVSKAEPGTMLKDLLPQLVNEALTDCESKQNALDILGSYVCVAGKVIPENDKSARQWIIDYSTHAELLGCTFLNEGDCCDTKDCCSYIKGWQTDERNLLIQYVAIDNGAPLHRVWKIVEGENLPSPPRRLYGMDAHPDYVHVIIPREAKLPSFQLTPLSPEQVKEDYEAVVESTSTLKGLLGSDWPVGLAEQDNILDLSWHEREFTLQRSFSWIVREPASAAGSHGTYLGCAYVFPEQGRRGRAKVVSWIRQGRNDREILHEKLRVELKVWLEAILPTNIVLEW